MDSCKAIAPSSTANLGPGFDTFGLALDIFNDEVRISKKGNKTKKITISNIKQEYGTKIPFEVENNSAALVVQRMMEDFKIDDYIDIEITKGIPPGYGLGSSAASSVAAAFAFNQVYNLKLDVNELINFAAEGERASAGIKHYDNVASSMLGGFIIARTTPKLEIIKFEPPEDLYLVIGIPKIAVPKKKTQSARSLLPLSSPLENIITNIANSSTIVAGFAFKDVEMIAKGIDDRIVEPARKKMIPGFD
ncbi:MAG TPA: homoserine kinase, partial [Nitrososphaeraceae archaeon]|nr:homoserine kinase [Nitrososphaeraceae archaeon]